jgi:hypothetical protein
MCKRWSIGVLLGCGLAALIFLPVLTYERQPRYGGRSLGEWLVIDRNAQIKGRHTQTIAGTLQMHVEGVGEPKAQEAVRHIGTNALHWLVKWVAYEPPAWRTNLYSQFCRLPQGLRPHFIDRLVAPAAPSRKEIAWAGFKVLGHDATPAIPELLRVIHASKPGSKTREYGITCLGLMGGDAVWAVSELTHDPDPITSTRAAYLERYLTWTTQVRPILQPPQFDPGLKEPPTRLLWDLPRVGDPAPLAEGVNAPPQTKVAGFDSPVARVSPPASPSAKSVPSVVNFPTRSPFPPAISVSSYPLPAGPLL